VLRSCLNSTLYNFYMESTITFVVGGEKSPYTPGYTNLINLQTKNLTTEARTDQTNEGKDK
jgi:hypothetical protein